jgi:glutamine amidotransferase
MSIAVVDYNAGNLRSVETALKYLGADFFISNWPEKIRAADKLIFPGVGEAKAAMQVLEASGLGQAITEFHKSGRPVLGICLGSHIVLGSSEESETRCLGLVPGTARRFPRVAGYKVPHMGWNQVNHDGKHYLFKGIPSGSSFYFVHSYYPDPQDREACIARTEYMLEFCSGLCLENLAAFQFHPEKSGACGLKLLENFIHVG